MSHILPFSFCEEEDALEFWKSTLETVTPGIELKIEDLKIVGKDPAKESFIQIDKGTLGKSVFDKDVVEDDADHGMPKFVHLALMVELAVQIREKCDANVRNTEGGKNQIGGFAFTPNWKDHYGRNIAWENLFIEVRGQAYSSTSVRLLVCVSRARFWGVELSFCGPPSRHLKRVGTWQSLRECGVFLVSRLHAFIGSTVYADEPAARGVATKTNGFDIYIVFSI